MIKRMSDEEFNNYADTRIKAELGRARQSELDLKAQIMELFDYLVLKFPGEILKEDASGACKTAINIMENQRKSIKLHGRLSELFKEETDILKLDRNKLIELVGRLKSICLQ